MTAQRCVDCGSPLATHARKRCAACAFVLKNGAVFTQRNANTERETVIECWCRRTTVWVRESVFAAGRTESCGLDTCTAERTAA